MAASELARLEHLSLVSKICTELDNHYSLNDKVHAMLQAAVQWTLKYP